jgi:hypothetical protein
MEKRDFSEEKKLRDGCGFLCAAAVIYRIDRWETDGRFFFFFCLKKVFCRKFRVSRRRKSRDYETVMPLEHKMRGIFTFCLVRARPFLFLGVTLCKQRNQCGS